MATHMPVFGIWRMSLYHWRMSEKHAAASRKRWANVPKAERSRRMALLALDKWDAMSAEQKKKQILKMVTSHPKNAK